MRSNLLEHLRHKLHIATYSKDALEVAIEFDLGIELNHVCISEYLDLDKLPQTLKWIEKDVKAAGLSFPYKKGERLILHGPFTEIVPSAMDPRAVEMGLERLEETYKLCKEIGLNQMVVHSGYFPPMYYKSWHHDRSMIFWDRFLKNKDDFTVIVENCFEDEPYMIAKLYDAFARPNFKLCLDTGHANTCSQPDLTIKDWIVHLGDRVSHYHIHNNDGTKDTHSPLPDGSLDMHQVLLDIEKFNKSNYTLTLESQDCKKCVNWLANTKV
ncbi:sugar phosphate isomerase/epimerase family protein [Eubacteriales bacterium KG127]